VIERLPRIQRAREVTARLPRIQRAKIESAQDVLDGPMPSTKTMPADLFFSTQAEMLCWSSRGRAEKLVG
jgi:hypothetical protein